MAKIDPAAWFAAAVGTPAAIVTLLKIGAGYPAWKERREARKLQAARELIAKADLQNALPSVVHDFPGVRAELTEMKALLLTISSQNSQVLTSLNDHTLSDTAEFAAMKKAIEGTASEVMQLKGSLTELTATVAGLADLRDYMRDGNGHSN